MKPTVYVTNWSSRKLKGPGRQLTIMAAPRSWERGDGAVLALTPDLRDLRDMQDGRITLPEYRRRFERALEGAKLGPGDLDVRDGDTLCCACSRAAAAAGMCHRVWAAEALARAGWRVVLDGVEVVRG